LGLLIVMAAVQCSSNDTHEIRVFQSIAAGDTNSVSRAFRDGWRYEADGKLDEAMAVFNTIVEFNTNNSHAHIAIGIVHARRGNNKLATKQYVRAVRIDPDIYEKLMDRGVAFEELKLYPEAIQEFRMAIAFNLRDAMPHWSLCLLYVMVGQYDDAISAGQRGIKVGVEDADTHWALGLAYEAKRMSTQAVTEYARAIELEPENETYHFDAAKMYLIEKKFEMAVKHYDISRSLGHETDRRFEKPLDEYR